MTVDRSIFPPTPPRKNVIRYIVLLFILLITIIIGNTIYSTHQESQKALEHTFSELHTKLRILLSIQNSELEKIKTISVIVREENQKYCDLLDYDNIPALTYMLKALASIHGIDIAVIFDEYGELLAGYPEFDENASTHAYEMMINDRQKRMDIEEISAKVLSGSSIAVPGSPRNVLAFISVIHLIHDTGEVYGYVVLANLISGNKGLAREMSEIAESEMAYYNNAEEPILTSFPKPKIPYPKTNRFTVDGEVNSSQMSAMKYGLR